MLRAATARPVRALSIINFHPSPLSFDRCVKVTPMPNYALRIATENNRAFVRTYANGVTSHVVKEETTFDGGTISSSTVTKKNTIDRTADVISSFEDARESFKGKSFMELLRAFIVFRLCGWRWLVGNSEYVLKISSKIFGVKLVNMILQSTFFGHFCAGVDENSIRPTIERLRINGVGGILDYAAEADITEKPKVSPNDDYTKNKVQCRIYDYEGEVQCDKNVEIFFSCVRAVHNTTPEGFAAIKITALGQPQILERMSKAIIETRKLFSQFDRDGNGKITREEFRLAFNLWFRDATEEEIGNIFERFDFMKSGYIDYVEWTSTIRVPEIWALVNRSHPGPLAEAVLNEEETELMENMFSRLNKIVEYASNLRVRLMVDAEQTYFQPAIDHLVLNLQRQFNKNFPTIFNTYQCYLKDSYDRVSTDLIRAKREGYYFAAKIVRGAYLVLEKKRAKEMGYEDPIQPSLDSTHQNYYKVLDLVLQNLHYSNVLVASHNQDTVTYTLKKMVKFNISPSDGGVYFGQLLGMADHLTFNLGRSGYKAYKYVPYGPIQEVVPYLIRRAQENSSVLGGAKNELKMIGSELKRRVKDKISM